jgi:hypothetical protein
MSVEEMKKEAIAQKINELSVNELDDLLQYLEMKVNSKEGEIDLLKHVPKIIREDKSILQKLAQ